MNPHELIKKYISGISQGLATSLIIKSKAGYGKTELTLLTLKELGFSEGIHYSYYNNYFTPLEFYKTLEETNQLQKPRLLILDDVEQILTDKKIIGLLKSALWETPNGKRKVCWTSGTWKIKNKEIEFQGRIIFLLNELKKKNPLIQALIDRSLFFEFELTNQEKISLMMERTELPYHDIPIQKRKEIVEFISKVAGNNPNLSLRVLPKIYQLYVLSPNHYKELAIGLLK